MRLPSRPGVRPRSMLLPVCGASECSEVYNFCLYRRRTEPHCFVPDPGLVSQPTSTRQPYIFSEQEMAKLLQAASGLRRVPSSPASSRSDSPRNRAAVHHRNPARGAAAPDSGRLQPARSASLHDSRDEVLQVSPASSQRRRSPRRWSTILRPSPTETSCLLRHGAHLQWTQGGRAYSGTNLRHCSGPLLTTMRHRHPERAAATDP